MKTNLGEGPYGKENRAVVTWPNKFIGNADSSPMIRDCDILYYRYALAVMLDAELKYYRRDYAGALASLNIIAKRAYGKENFHTSATQGDVLKALCNEYLLEFPCEGVVWWALIRLDRIWEYNADLKARKDAANILLWPISKSARDKIRTLPKRRDGIDRKPKITEHETEFQEIYGGAGDCGDAASDSLLRGSYRFGGPDDADSHQS